MRENQFVPLQKTIFVEWDSICTWALQKIRYGERTIDHFPETDGLPRSCALQRQEQLYIYASMVSADFDNTGSAFAAMKLGRTSCWVWGMTISLATQQIQIWKMNDAQFWLWLRILGWVDTTNSYKWSICRSIDATCSSHTRQSWKTLAWCLINYY